VSSIKILYDEETIDRRVREMAEEINKDYDEPVLVVGVLKGGAFFTCDLVKRLTMPVTMDFVSVSSYGSGTKSTGFLKFKKDIDEDVSGKHVLITEDIIDSGRTLSMLRKVFEEHGAKSVRIAVMLDKPARREVKDVKVEYTGFTIPDMFVVGYGLDFDQQYRNLPYIGVVEE